MAALDARKLDSEPGFKPISASSHVTSLQDSVFLSVKGTGFDDLLTSPLVLRLQDREGDRSLGPIWPGGLCRYLHLCSSRLAETLGPDSPGQIFSLLLASCVDLGMLLTLCEPQFLHP